MTKSAKTKVARRESAIGIAALGLLFAFIWLIPKIARYRTPSGPDVADRIAGREINLIIGPAAFLFFLAAYFLLPALQRALPKARMSWRSSFTLAVSVTIAAALALFIFHFR